MKFIYDTGSSWLWVPLKECNGCPTNNLYDRSKSNSLIDLGESKELFYGRGYVNGSIVQDDVSIDKNSTIRMKMLAVHVAKDLEGTKADGILGLSPTENVLGTNFVKQLFD